MRIATTAAMRNASCRKRVPVSKRYAAARSLGWKSSEANRLTPRIAVAVAGILRMASRECSVVMLPIGGNWIVI